MEQVHIEPDRPFSNSLWNVLGYAATGLCLLLALVLTSPASAAGRHSSWWPAVEKIGQDIEEERYKPAARAASRLAKNILSKAWNDRELGQVLAEVALYQAIAYEHLDQRWDAIWYWQVAQNLDPKIKRRDLSKYGKAGQLLAKHPLRPLGKPPTDLAVERSRSSKDFKPARKLKLPQPMHLANNAGAAQGAPKFKAEFVVDQRGRVVRPVLAGPNLHPVATYATLESFRGRVLFEPAKLGKKPVAVLQMIEMNYDKTRW